MKSAHKTLFRTMMLVAATSLLAACAGEGSYFPERTGYIEPTQPNEVSVTGLDHTIQLSPGQTSLAPAQVGELNEFLALNGRGDGDRIEIRTRLGNTGQASSPNANIASDLRKSFIRGGYLPSQVETYNDYVSASTIHISIKRYEVLVPDCGTEWVGDTSVRNEPTGLRSLGCSNERNLGLMIADPRDLTGERELSPADSERSIRAVKSYRAGEASDLDAGGGGGAEQGAPTQ